MDNKENKSPNTMRRSAEFLARGVKHPATRWTLITLFIIAAIAIALFILDWLGLIGEYVMLIVLGTLLVIALVLYFIAKVKGK